MPVSPLRPVEDLVLNFDLAKSPPRPYLGAWAHAAIAAEGLTSFHPRPIPLLRQHKPRQRNPYHSSETLPAPKPSAWRPVSIGRTLQTLAAVPAGGQSRDRTVLLQWPRELHPTAPGIPKESIRIKSRPQATNLQYRNPSGKPVKLAFERSADPIAAAKYVFPYLGISRCPFGRSSHRINSRVKQKKAELTSPAAWNLTRQPRHPLVWPSSHRNPERKTTPLRRPGSPSTAPHAHPSSASPMQPQPRFPRIWSATACRPMKGSKQVLQILRSIPRHISNLIRTSGRGFPPPSRGPDPASRSGILGSMPPGCAHTHTWSLSPRAAAGLPQSASPSQPRSPIVCTA